MTLPSAETTLTPPTATRPVLFARLPVYLPTSTPTKAVRTHVAGVYSGELLDYGNIDNGAPRDYIYPIKIPSGGNFLVWKIFTSTRPPTTLCLLTMARSTAREPGTSSPSACTPVLLIPQAPVSSCESVAKATP